MLKRLVRKLKSVLIRSEENLNEIVVTLKPEGEVIGRVLMSYTSKPLMIRDDDSLDNKHTVAWECRQIARTFVEMGYIVDGISYENRTFEPKEKYDVYLGVLESFQRYAPKVNKDCIKIFHIIYSHWLYHNYAQYKRLMEIKQKKGIALSPTKMLEPHKGIEYADVATILGNEFTAGTYAFANKPMLRIPISTNGEFNFEIRDYANCKKRFLWFNSAGFVHKGLDVVLEAFCSLPDYQLLICGPLNHKIEIEFEKAFFKELNETENIKPVGWIDVTSPAFMEIAKTAIGVISPSCSEGGGGATITCMHAGLIPIVSYESSVDIKDDFGMVMSEITAEEVVRCVKEISDLNNDKLLEMSKKSYEYALANHTREIFAIKCREVMQNICNKVYENK